MFVERLTQKRRDSEKDVAEKDAAEKDAAERDARMRVQMFFLATESTKVTKGGWR
jgi:hypothetical protein